MCIFAFEVTTIYIYISILSTSVHVCTRAVFILRFQPTQGLAPIARVSHQDDQTLHHTCSEHVNIALP